MNIYEKIKLVRSCITHIGVPQIFDEIIAQAEPAESKDPEPEPTPEPVPEPEQGDYTIVVGRQLDIPNDYDEYCYECVINDSLDLNALKLPFEDPEGTEGTIKLNNDIIGGLGRYTIPAGEYDGRMYKTPVGEILVRSESMINSDDKYVNMHIIIEDNTTFLYAEVMTSNPVINPGGGGTLPGKG